MWYKVVDNKVGSAQLRAVIDVPQKYMPAEPEEDAAAAQKVVDVVTESESEEVRNRPPSLTSSSLTSPSLTNAQEKFMYRNSYALYGTYMLVTEHMRALRMII